MPPPPALPPIAFDEDWFLEWKALGLFSALEFDAWFTYCKISFLFPGDNLELLSYEFKLPLDPTFVLLILLEVLFCLYLWRKVGVSNLLSYYCYPFSILFYYYSKDCLLYSTPYKNLEIDVDCPTWPSTLLLLLYYC